MKAAIIKMTRDEYSNGEIAIRDYKILFLGIPVYRARFTSTNRDAIKLLATKPKHTQIQGFFNNTSKDETKDINKKVK